MRLEWFMNCVVRRLFLLFSLCSVGVCSVLFGCGGVGRDGAVVGGPCTMDAECVSQSRCLTDGDYPGGYCVTNCTKHEDCPTGARCINKEGGVCLLECDLPADCRGGYTCKGRNNESGGGESLVCTN